MAVRRGHKFQTDYRAAAKEEAKKLAEGRDCGQAGKGQSSGVGSLQLPKEFISITQGG